MTRVVKAIPSRDPQVAGHRGACWTRCCKDLVFEVPHRSCIARGLFCLRLSALRFLLSFLVSSCTVGSNRAASTAPDPNKRIWTEGSAD